MIIKKPTEELYRHLYYNLSILAFATILPITEIALKYFSPFFIAFGSASIAGIISFPVVILYQRSIPSVSDLKDILFGGSALIYGFPVCIGMGLLTIPSNIGAIIVAITPFLTAILMSVKSNGLLSKRVIYLSIFGIGLIIFFIFINNEVIPSIGHVFLILGGWFAAYGYVVSLNLIRSHSGAWIVSWSFVLFF